MNEITPNRKYNNPIETPWDDLAQQEFGDDIQSAETDKEENAEQKTASKLDKVLTEAKNKLNDEDNLKPLAEAAEPFISSHEPATIDQRKTQIENFFEALDNIYDVRYEDHHRTLSASLYFNDKKYASGWSLNYETGHIIIPENQLAQSSNESIVFSLCHEYGHMIMRSESLQDNSLVATRFAHDTKIDEIGATRFAFDVMDKLKIDKTKITRYEEWQRALSYFDTRNKLEESYGEDIADIYRDVFAAIGEYEWFTSDQVINSRRGAPATGMLLGLLRAKSRMKYGDIKRKAIKGYRNLEQTLSRLDNGLLAAEVDNSIRRELDALDKAT